MFADYKSQFIWCIICTFLSGIVTGIDIFFIENKEIHIIFIILNLLTVLFNIKFWKNIFYRLNLQDKITSFYKDLD